MAEEKCEACGKANPTPGTAELPAIRIEAPWMGDSEQVIAYYCSPAHRDQALARRKEWPSGPPLTIDESKFIGVAWKTVSGFWQLWYGALGPNAPAWHLAKRGSSDQIDSLDSERWLRSDAETLRAWLSERVPPDVADQLVAGIAANPPAGSGWRTGP